MKRLMTIVSLTAFFCAFFLSCKEESQEVSLSDPENLQTEIVGENSVRLSWTDKNTSETGFWVFARGEGDAFHVRPVNMDNPLPADSGEYLFEGLTPGKGYDFGVQALAADPKNNSSVVYTDRVQLPVVLGTPSDISLTLDNNAAVTMTWTAAKSAESYSVYVKSYTDADFGDAAANVTTTSYKFEKLPFGVYEFGVRAESGNSSTDIVKGKPVRVQTASKTPEINSVNTSYAFVNVEYTSNLRLTSVAHGLVISETNPYPNTTDDRVFWGPALPSDKKVKQLIPNAVLEYGKKYYLAVYTSEGTANTYYSETIEVALDEEPELPVLSWKKIANPSGVPSTVEVYSTETPLNGRPFKAWYAIADCGPGSDVEFRVMEPADNTLKTIDKQVEEYGEDCYVLVNGGYFYKPSDWTSPFVIDGVRPLGRDAYGGSNTSDGGWAVVTPGVLGVDPSGKPDAFFWMARPNDATYYYRMPLPTVPDQAKYWYEASTELPHFPCDSTGWNAYNAISAGPMVLYNNRVVVDHTHNGSYYTTNYELRADDQFPGYLPDRTVVGHTADGKVVLFICDGRVDESDGASCPELGLIMKSLGCVAALNLDGGGSTGMMLRDQHLNTWEQGKGTSRRSEYRAVWTTAGFFKKRAK